MIAVSSSRLETGRIWLLLARVSVDPLESHAVVPSIMMRRTGPVQDPFTLPGFTLCLHSITSCPGLYWDAWRPVAFASFEKRSAARSRSKAILARSRSFTSPWKDFPGWTPTSNFSSSRGPPPAPKAHWNALKPLGPTCAFIDAAARENRSGTENLLPSRRRRATVPFAMLIALSSNPMIQWASAGAIVKPTPARLR